jgi:hypothetical protein
MCCFIHASLTAAWLGFCMCRGQSHTWGEVELPDAAHAAFSLHGVGAGHDFCDELGRQGVPVHHGGAATGDAISSVQLLAEAIATMLI